jgi:hypothetical protein
MVVAASSVAGSNGRGGVARSAGFHGTMVVYRQFVAGRELSGTENVVSREVFENRKLLILWIGLRL